MSGASDEQIETFLATGELVVPRGPGQGARRAAATQSLRALLVRIVQWRARHAPLQARPVPPDLVEVVRQRTRGIVFGLFEAEDAAIVWERLPSMVVVVTPDTLAELLPMLPLRRGWDLANLVLDDLGAPPLSDDAPSLAGLCEGSRCFLLPSALDPVERGQDVLVHEIAHVIVGVDRAELGLQPGPSRVLPMALRETFAWAAEAWADVEHHVPVETRGAALARVLAGPAPEDARVDRVCWRAALEAALQGGWPALWSRIAAS